MGKKILPYDDSSWESILKYARILLGHSLKELYPHSDFKISGKGGLGTAVEDLHFKLYQDEEENRNKPEPDFKKAGLELKTTSLKILSDKSIASKDRLVLNTINYESEGDSDFITSSFWKKNKFLLLMFYLYKKGACPLDFIFKIVRCWEIPEEDLKIIKDDWAIIHKKIHDGLAHEISQGDTLYLAACPKGPKAQKVMRRQPRTEKRAQQRAYSFKQKYVNTIILDSLDYPEMHQGLFISEKYKKKILEAKKKVESIVRNVSDYRGSETFEQLIERKFAPYYGKTIAEIECSCGVEFGQSKSMAYNVCQAILLDNNKKKKIAEFEKAEIAVKTIRLEANGNLVQHMSFPNINYKEIINEKKWEDSALYNLFTQRFLFVVFRKPKERNDKQVKLEKIMFWTMPTKDLKQGQKLWTDTRKKVKNGDYDNFIKISDGLICHIRPKSKKSTCLTTDAYGRKVKKMCYWLDKKYILEIIK